MIPSRPEPDAPAKLPGATRRRSRRRHRILKVLALVGVVLGIVVFAVSRTYFAGGGDTREIPVDEIIRRFEASRPVATSPSVPGPAVTSQTAAPAEATTEAAPTATVEPVSTTASTLQSPPQPAVVLPAPGVYVYATTGGDSIDVLSGVGHEYPETTTITVTPTDCGVSQRWDVVAERWEEWQRCAAVDGVAETGRMTYDEFFEIGETSTYECTGDSRPTDAAAGTTWVHTCRSGDKLNVHTGTVVGVEQVSVGGTSVQALHVQTTIDNGAESDRQATDSWYQLGSDLLLVQSALNQTTNRTAYGVVHYEEHYEIRLTSLDHLG